jgi:hypothetical protein
MKYTSSSILIVGDRWFVALLPSYSELDISGIGCYSIDRGYGSEIGAPVAKRPGFEVLLPLLPLTKGGNTLEIVDDMINELLARNRSDLLGLGHFCAGLVFTDEMSKQWLKERFDKVLEIIQESWTYQETLQKGIEKGLKEGLQQGIQTAQQTAIDIVAKRFPQLELLAKALITTISDLNQLQMLTIELSIASSQEHAKELLLSLASAA